MVNARCTSQHTRRPVTRHMLKCHGCNGHIVCQNNGDLPDVRGVCAANDTLRDVARSSENGLPSESQASFKMIPSPLHQTPSRLQATEGIANQWSEHIDRQGQARDPSHIMKRRCKRRLKENRERCKILESLQENQLITFWGRCKNALDHFALSHGEQQDHQMTATIEKEVQKLSGAPGMPGLLSGMAIWVCSPASVLMNQQSRDCSR